LSSTSLCMAIHDFVVFGVCLPLGKDKSIDLPKINYETILRDKKE